MNHPLLPGKCDWFTSPGFKLYSFLLFFFAAMPLYASAECNAVITVEKNSRDVEDKNPDFCEGGVLKLTAWVKRADGSRVDGKSYSWSPGGGTDKHLEVREEGTYTVTVIDQSGCSSTATVEVTKRAQVEKPVLSVNGEPTTGIKEICDNNSVELSVPLQNEIVYVWEKDGVAIPNAGNTNKYTVNGEPGKYTVRVSNSCGGVSSDPVEIILTETPQAPVIEAEGPRKFCYPGSVRLKVPKVDNAVYTWRKDGNIFSPRNTEFIDTDASGVYTVEVRNECGATTSSEGVKVEAVPLVVAQGEDVKACMNTNATLTATGGSAGNYRWYTSNDPNATADPSRRDETYVTQILTQDATFYVAVYNGVCEGPKKAIKVTVTRSKIVNKPAIKTSGPTSFCQGGEVKLSVPKIEGITYQWIKDNAPMPKTNSYELSVKESGTYTVILKDACGDVEADGSINVQVFDFPEPPKVEDTYSCNPSQFILKASGGAEGDYRWYDSKSNPTAFFGETGSSYTTSYLDANKTYYVSIMRNGCESERMPISAIISGPPTADAGPDLIVNPGESVTLQGGGGGSYEWLPATGLSNPNIANPEARPMQTTTYTLRVSRGADCWTEDQMTVIVREALDIPNAFSPNGDGTNDVWEIGNVDAYPDARIEIFNRWGSKVYDKVGYQNDWNGTYRGSLLPVGVYFYVITLHGGYKMTGSLSIVQ